MAGGLVTKLCPTLRSRGLQPARLLCPWGFSREEHWSGLPRPPPGDLPNPGSKPAFLMSPALAGGFFTSATWENPRSEYAVHIGCLPCHHYYFL